MDVIRLDTTRQLVREEIFEYLEDNSETFTISPPHPAWGIEFWINYITGPGKELDTVINEIFKRLENSERMKPVRMPVQDSATVAAGTHYYKTIILMAIYEEIADLIRAGVLLQVNLGTKLPSYEVTFAPVT